MINGKRFFGLEVSSLHGIFFLALVGFIFLVPSSTPTAEASPPVVAIAPQEKLQQTADHLTAFAGSPPNVGGI